MAGGVGGDDEEYIQLNLTAMVDVVMLLIIFFVSNLKFPQEEGTMSAELPKVGKGGVVAKIDKIVIGVDSDHANQVVRVIVNNVPVVELPAKVLLLNRIEKTDAYGNVVRDDKGNVVTETEYEKFMRDNPKDGYEKYKGEVYRYLRSLNTKLFTLQRTIPDAEVTLDVKPDVPYTCVIEVFSMCAANHFTKVAFAQPAAGP